MAENFSQRGHETRTYLCACHLTFYLAKFIKIWKKWNYNHSFKKFCRKLLTYHQEISMQTLVVTLSFKINAKIILLQQVRITKSANNPREGTNFKPPYGVSKLWCPKWRWKSFIYTIPWPNFTFRSCKRVDKAKTLKSYCFTLNC